MNYVWVNLIILLIGYLIGSFNISIILTKKIKKQDIREVGSKNAGATNALRMFGTKIALVVFIFDILKSYIPIMLVYMVQKLLDGEGYSGYLIPLIIGLGVVIGHIFPLYFKFKGGKGASCILGMFIATNVILFFIGLILYLIILYISRYVSIASIIAPFILACIAFVPWFSVGILGFTNQYNAWWIPAVILIISDIFVIGAHHENIKRLLNNSEKTLRFLEKKTHKDSDDNKTETK